MRKSIPQKMNTIVDAVRFVKRGGNIFEPMKHFSGMDAQRIEEYMHTEDRILTLERDIKNFTKLEKLQQDLEAVRMAHETAITLLIDHDRFQKLINNDIQHWCHRFIEIEGRISRWRPEEELRTELMEKKKELRLRGIVRIKKFSFVTM